MVPLGLPSARPMAQALRLPFEYYIIIIIIITIIIIISSIISSSITIIIIIIIIIVMAQKHNKLEVKLPKGNW